MLCVEISRLESNRSQILWLVHQNSARKISDLSGGLVKLLLVSSYANDTTSQSEPPEDSSSRTFDRLLLEVHHLPIESPTSRIHDDRVKRNLLLFFFCWDKEDKMGKLTSTIGIPIKLLNEAQVGHTIPFLH
jgi:hypothetical protein